MSKCEYLEIKEFDEAGDVVATYVASGNSRVDVVLPREKKSYSQRVLDVFLPAGYPQSVTEDYIQYQIYDSLQAFSSSIAGLLASRAVLEGVGVGDSTASPTSALLLSILQESMGRLATILFAHRLGTSLEPECKMYRLAADILNDTAIVLDCLSPAFPKPARSAKASLSAHFAKRGNLGELNAKDSSQETVISLLGMLTGSVVVSAVTTPMATWATLIALLSVHLATNYAAVKAVSMTSLNRQRANIVFSHVLDADNPRVLSPKEVSEQERVFERDGVLRYGNDILGHCRIGVSLQSLLGSMNLAMRSKTGAFQDLPIKLPDILEVFAHEGYILWLDESQTREVRIVLKKDCTALDQLKAWVHALTLVRVRSQTPPSAFLKGEHVGQDVQRLAELLQILKQNNELFDKYTPSLRSAGWDLDMAALETRAGLRALIDRTKDSSGQ
ncbi:hypothetical protein E8E12_007957 [Didymella heteroderae]|uniref:Uncharacterized protein n=1 Tax=Didymella heteroderae TaxID=1769908 RepID=A0A9P5BZ44_9PLEO|nr:hypothetical protein E8E12_007957 [Didymella heteroderae]